MVASIGFTSSVVSQSLLLERVLKQPHRDILACKSRQLQQPKYNNLCYATFRNPWNLFALPPTNSSPESDVSSPLYSTAQTITLFYSAINDRNLKELDKLIADDCAFEDYTFIKPFQGKKEVMHFLGELISSMGENMQFNVEHICQGNDYTASVNWHIDWNKIQVPFTKGSSFYAFSIDGDDLVIKRAQVLVESPIKLGVVALTTFRIVSSIFDAFPSATEWLLNKSQFVFNLALMGFGMAFGIVIKPMLGPVLAWYVKLMNFVARVIKFAINVLYYMRKIVPM